jgi:hypothetical protein
MSLAAAFLLAIVGASAQPAPADDPRQVDRGAQIASAHVSVRILRPVVLKDGKLASGREAPRSQRHADGGYVTYTFE